MRESLQKRGTFEKLIKTKRRRQRWAWEGHDLAGFTESMTLSKFLKDVMQIKNLPGRQ